jgi:hypothetical protein
VNQRAEGPSDALKVPQSSEGRPSCTRAMAAFNTLPFLRISPLATIDFILPCIEPKRR